MSSKCPFLTKKILHKLTLDELVTNEFVLSTIIFSCRGVEAPEPDFFSFRDVLFGSLKNFDLLLQINKKKMFRLSIFVYIYYW